MVKERRISVSVTDDMYEFLMHRSGEVDRSMASMVRYVLQNWMEDRNVPALNPPSTETLND